MSDGEPQSPPERQDTTKPENATHVAEASKNLDAPACVQKTPHRPFVIAPCPPEVFHVQWEALCRKAGIEADEKSLSYDGRLIDLHALHCEVLNILNSDAKVRNTASLQAIQATNQICFGIN